MRKDHGISKHQGMEDQGMNDIEGDPEEQQSHFTQAPTPSERLPQTWFGPDIDLIRT